MRFRRVVEEFIAVFRVVQLGEIGRGLQDCAHARVAPRIGRAAVAGDDAVIVAVNGGNDAVRPFIQIEALITENIVARRAVIILGRVPLILLAACDMHREGILVLGIGGLQANDVGDLLAALRRFLKVAHCRGGDVALADLFSVRVLVVTLEIVQRNGRFLCIVGRVGRLDIELVALRLTLVHIAAEEDALAAALAVDGDRLNGELRADVVHPAVAVLRPLVHLQFLIFDVGQASAAGKEGAIKQIRHGKSGELYRFLVSNGASLVAGGQDLISAVAVDVTCRDRAAGERHPIYLHLHILHAEVLYRPLARVQVGGGRSAGNNVSAARCAVGHREIGHPEALVFYVRIVQGVAGVRIGQHGKIVQPVTVEIAHGKIHGELILRLAALVPEVDL